MDQPGSVGKLIQHEQRVHPHGANHSNITASPCIQIPRRRFGTVESSSNSSDSKSNNNNNNDDTPAVSSFINAYSQQLLTTRWRYHASDQNYYQNRISKCIVDVSQLSQNDDILPVDSIHRPLKQYCGRRKLHIQAPQQLLLIHHYLGTWEQYNFRQRDARLGNERSRNLYDPTARLAQGKSDMVVPWWRGFVETVGAARAEYLLRGSGVVVSVGVDDVVEARAG